MDRFDRYWIGALIGLLAPALFIVAYLSRMHLWDVISLDPYPGNTFFQLIYLSVFPDMALIFLFYTMDVWKLSKGILIGAMPYLLVYIWFMV